MIQFWYRFLVKNVRISKLRNNQYTNETLNNWYTIKEKTLNIVMIINAYDNPTHVHPL